MNKFSFVRDLLGPRATRGDRLLDVGCRRGELRDYVDGLVDYVGLDLEAVPGAPVNILADLGRGLPFRDGAMDFVVALDVLEHVDAWSRGLDELVRVTSHSCVVMVPNMSHVLFRMRFLRYGRLGGKYDIYYGTVGDRHRWLPIQRQTDAYFSDYADHANLDLEMHRFVAGRKLGPFGRISRRLGLSPALWVWATCYVLTRRDDQQ